MSSQVFPLDERRQPALLRSFVLALLVHVGLVAFMFLGVRWQSSPPDVVQVELWEPPPPPPPAPVVEAPKPPPQAEPEPPKPEPEPPKPEPKIEKPDIALKAPKPEPKPKPKPEPKAEPKPKPKPKPVPPKADDFKKRMQEQLAQEQRAIEEQRREAEQRQAREQIAREAAAARAAARDKALAAWTDKIRAKIRGNILLPPNIPGNPEAVFDVAQLPTGEVLSVRLRRSSGHPAYDEAIQRAIYKSSPLPKPDQPNLFERELELRFRPQDK